MGNELNNIHIYVTYILDPTLAATAQKLRPKGSDSTPPDWSKRPDQSRA
jgi:hypothetical protein